LEYSTRSSKEVAMTLTIDLSPETERKLLEQATVTGMKVSNLVEQALEEKFAAKVRRHDAFLNSYVPEDEGLYDDLAR
jgi:predicted transcriptional regulator